MESPLSCCGHFEPRHDAAQKLRKSEMIQVTGHFTQRADELAVTHKIAEDVPYLKQRPRIVECSFGHRRQLVSTGVHHLEWVAFEVVAPQATHPCHDGDAEQSMGTPSSACLGQRR